MFLDGLLVTYQTGQLLSISIKGGLEGSSSPSKMTNTDELNHTDWGRFTSFTQFLVTKGRLLQAEDRTTRYTKSKGPFKILLHLNDLFV